MWGSLGFSLFVPEPYVPVPFSAVNVDCEILIDSCEIVEPQTLSLSRKRKAFFFAGSQEVVHFDGTLLKALLASRRGIMPPTPQQSEQPSYEGYATADGGGGPGIGRL